MFNNISLANILQISDEFKNQLNNGQTKPWRRKKRFLQRISGKDLQIINLPPPWSPRLYPPAAASSSLWAARWAWGRGRARGRGRRGWGAGRRCPRRGRWPCRRSGWRSRRRTRTRWWRGWCAAPASSGHCSRTPGWRCLQYPQYWNVTRVTRVGLSFPAEENETILFSLVNI